MPGRSLWLVLLLSFLCVTHAGSSHGQCGDLANESAEGYSVGPFDYRTPNMRMLKLVETFHFTPEVERLTKGATNVMPGPDLSYTLKAFPNHPRALLAMINLGFKMKTDQPVGSAYTVQCWLDRAERFQPDDGAVETLYGIYFLRKGQPKVAIVKLERAAALSGESANIHYNLGLASFDLHDYDQALEHAHAAYRLGFPLPGLRKKLMDVRKWRPAPDPEPIASPPATTTNQAEPPAPSKPDASRSGQSGG